VATVFPAAHLLFNAVSFSVLCFTFSPPPGSCPLWGPPLLGISSSQGVWFLVAEGPPENQPTPPPKLRRDIPFRKRRRPSRPQSLTSFPWTFFFPSRSFCYLFNRRNGGRRLFSFFFSSQFRLAHTFRPHTNLVSLSSWNFREL